MRVGTVISLLACLGLSSAQVITRDVTVIGGGSAGTYAAVNLRERNRTVAVIEKSGRLGGHTDTYFDSATGTHVDFGVIFYENLTVVQDYFNHFGIPLTTVPPSGGEQPQRIDFRSGTPVDASQGNVSDALSRYAVQLLKYPYLAVGFDLPDPVPEDLTLPFGEFVQKHDLGAVVDVIFSYAQGVGDLLQLPTIYVMKYVSLEVLDAMQNGFLQTTNRNNGALYVGAAEQLAADIFFNSTVVSMDRDSDPDWVHIDIQTPDGHQSIRTKQVISAIPPTLENLDGYDLDEVEQGLFGLFSSSCYYTALARVDGLPARITAFNRANETQYNLPPLPGVYVLTPTAVPGLYSILYGSEDFISEDNVKEAMSQAVQYLQVNSSNPEYVAYEAHSPFELKVSPETIAIGFYRELNALQGHRRTYYTGAAFDAHDSSRIWRFTETLLQRMQGKQ